MTYSVRTTLWNGTQSTTTRMPSLADACESVLANRENGDGTWSFDVVDAAGRVVTRGEVRRLLGARAMARALTHGTVR